MEDQKNKLLERSKLSFNDLKKVNVDLERCRFKDFQPLLKYTFWNFFELIAEKMIKRCKESAHFLDLHMGDLYELTQIDSLEKEIERHLFKSISFPKGSEGFSKDWISRIGTLSKDATFTQSLHLLLAQRRDYSKVSVPSSKEEHQ